MVADDRNGNRIRNPVSFIREHSCQAPPTRLWRRGYTCRQPLEELLGKLNGPVTAPEQMRGLRCVAVLEHIGRPEAIRLLDELGKGPPGAKLTRGAKAALERLNMRKEAMP
jgi:hypothetical protein